MKMFSSKSIEGAKTLMNQANVMPVISLSERAHALPLAQVLYDAGFRIFEITLRHACALDVISELRSTLPDATIGAGTVLGATQVEQVQSAGGQFIVTPGLSEPLLDALVDSGLPAIPGIATASEIVQGYQRGLRCFKFYPAKQAGGIEMLKAFQGPFSELSFCPTGGLNIENFMAYLALDNVPIVGGTWLTPQDLVVKQAWDEIAELVRQTQACLLNNKEYDKKRGKDNIGGHRE